MKLVLEIKWEITISLIKIACLNPFIVHLLHWGLVQHLLSQMKLHYGVL